MSVKIPFEKFKQSLRSRSISLDSISMYIEWDDDSLTPKLKFKPNVLLDEAPASYDLDEEVYQHLRDLENDQDDSFEDLFRRRPRVVVEGDSWYNLPFLIKPFAIADWMKEHRRLNVKNIARWGHTLDKILAQDEYMKAIERHQPQYFMICGGGNDIQNSLAEGRLLHRYSAEREAADYLTEDGVTLIEYISNGLQSIMERVQSHHSDLPIYIHGYDYPRPWVGRGKYIGRHLRELNIPSQMWDELMHNLIDLLNARIQAAVEQVDTATYIDFRNATDDYEWHDDLHPTAMGFNALSLKFESVMGIRVET